MVKATQKIQIGQLYFTFKEWKYVIIMIHSVVVIIHTIAISFVEDKISKFHTNLVFLSMSATLYLVIDFQIANIFYSYIVLFLAALNYQDVFRQSITLYFIQNEKCDEEFNMACIIAVMKYTFSVINIFATFYYVVPIILSIVIYSSTFNKYTNTKSVTTRFYNFFKQKNNESFGAEEITKFMYNEKNTNREKKALYLLGSKIHQCVLITQFTPITKEPMCIQDFVNSRGKQIFYINNYTDFVDSNNEGKQTFLHSISGYQWIPGTP
uniref:Transmembrane protein n=1 Tax=Parastrongyloides trichosuri TaxID=131310 RepID=A0A0N5A5A7_PARTI